MHLASYARNRQALYETPREIPVEFPLDRKRFRTVFDSVLGEGHDEAVRVARRIGYPVAIKILSPEISHKTDVGGVDRCSAAC